MSAALGFVEGPVLALNEAPFAEGWEQDPHLDDHAHEWERVIVRFSHSRHDEPCVRCAVCHCPRCGHSDDPDPCMERRHHDSVHITLGGSFEPVGGYLRPEGRSL